MVNSYKKHIFSSSDHLKTNHCYECFGRQNIVQFLTFDAKFDLKR